MYHCKHLIIVNKCIRPQGLLDPLAFPPPILCDYNSKMNSEVDWQRIIEWSHSEATYLLRAVATPDQLELQLEDKFTGDLWHAAYSSPAIEELTEKAKNRKKYSVFATMLRTALDRTKDNLFIEILSYREITIKTMKNGKASTVIPPEQAAKRFLILNYNIDFEKIQFPISIKPFTEASPERLRLTIKRMAQEGTAFRSQRTQSEIEKENAYLKYELDALKAKLKNTGKVEGGSMIMQSKLEDLQKENSEKMSIIEKLNGKIAQLEKSRQEALQKLQISQQKTQSLQQLLKQAKAITQKPSSKANEQKLQHLIAKMQKLGNDLIFAQQKQKKSQIKIATLEKQLQGMQKTQQRSTIRYKEDQRVDSPPSRSEKQLSVKSGRSNKSGKSNTSKKNISSIIKGMKTTANYNNNPNANYKKYSNKKVSVYDSDTESSRMRRLNNNRSSPFRQGTVNPSKKNPKQRSRSKSREKVISPKPSNIVESQMYSEAFQSDDSDQRFERLQRQIGKGKGKVQASRKTASRVSGVSHQENMESKLQSLQDLIRKAAQSTKQRN